MTPFPVQLAVASPASMTLALASQRNAALLNTSTATVRTCRLARMIDIPFG
jgi:hypothetical protein